MHKEITMRAMHDLGGVEPAASAPIDRAEHELTQFDKNVDALMYLLSHPSRRLIRVDELRRAIESFTPIQYASLSYYEKWLQAMHNLLVEKGVLRREEVDTKLAALRAEKSA
jgi:Nitrile hydratase beta subunit